ncbi:acyl-CoA dehydrogenase [Rhizobium sp. NFR07]|uniref:acyl-CoA dehydrogenase family protein n=1 Tax=Rhizobium sp. NFR07 TaxID=1566262 RepID=UPI001AEC83A1|nr:acyl-CoA dehydrogenase [Rhizobium sp. NFR07]
MSSARRIYTSIFENEIHESLRQEVRTFAEQHVRPWVSSFGRNVKLIDDLTRHIASLGWIGATIPKRYGGPALGAVVQASQLGVAKVVHFGSEEQKQKWLPLFAKGASLPTIAVTERDSGGDVLGMQSTAQRDSNEYILNGHKCFVGNSHIGDVHGVVMRTGQGARGLSAFLVERTRPGFAAGQLGDQAGMHGFSYGELLFDNCRVPEQNRLGREGDGLSVAYSSSVLYGRPNLTAVALGIHQAIFDDTVRFCQERQHRGAPLSKLPTIAAMVGEMLSRLCTARMIAYQAVAMLDRGEKCDAELMNAKLVNTENALSSARVAMEIFAARGCQRDYSIERYLLDVLHTFPAAGTSDIQRLRLAQIAFGTYGEAWSSQLREHIRLATDHQLKSPP